MNFAERIKKARLITLYSMAGLALVLTGNWLAEGGNSSAFPVLGVQLLPLFFFWAGVAKGKPSSYFWLCVILMLYAVKAIVGVIAWPPELLALLELAVTLTLFFASYYYVRWTVQQNKAAVSKPDAAA